MRSISFDASTDSRPVFYVWEVHVGRTLAPDLPRVQSVHADNAEAAVLSIAEKSYGRGGKTYKVVAADDVMQLTAQLKVSASIKA